MNRKYIRYLFVIISLFFIGILPVSAKENCTSVKSRLDLYDSYEETLKNTDCTDTSDVTIVNTCNDANVQKNLIITELMKLKEQGKICENEKTKVDKIIDDNKDTCGQIFDDDFNNFVNNALTMFYVIGPILLILFGSLDYAKATTSTEKDALKKANVRFAKRVAATLLLFLTPTIINLILSLNVSDKYLSGNAYTCDYKYLIYNKKYNIKYIAKTNSSTHVSSSNSSGKKVGDYIIYDQWDPAWADEYLITSQSIKIGPQGCALVSTAMQVVNSGIVSQDKFNPKIFNDNMISIYNKFGRVSDLMYWGDVEYKGTTGTFKYSSQEHIYGNINDKAPKLQQYINEGNYPVIQVKYGTDGSMHYVAVLEVQGTNIIVGDPAGGTKTILNDSGYPIASENLNTQVILYKVEK